MFLWVNTTVNDRHPYNLGILDSLSNTDLHYEGSICNVAYSVPPTQKNPRFDVLNFIIKTIRKSVPHLRISSKRNLETIWYMNEMKKNDIHGSVHRKFITSYNQQDAMLHYLFIYLFISTQCSTCFRRFLRPSSGAHKFMSSNSSAIAAGSSKGLTNTRCRMGGRTAWNM